MSSPRLSANSPPYPPSPSKVRFTLPIPTHTTISDDDCASSIDSDSDEDDRVFFGSPKLGEEALVARLSKAVPATPRSRLVKRDSREFLRRKTILVTPPWRSAVEVEDDGDEEEETVAKQEKGKVWPGGFHERRSSHDSGDSSSPSSSRSSPTPALYAETPGRRIEEDHCDLTFDFSRFRVSDSPLSNMQPSLRPVPPRRPSVLSGAGAQSDMDGKSDVESSASESEEEDWSDTEGEDSDKENAPAPMDPVESEEEERVEYPLFQGPLTGSGSGPGIAEEDDILRELDMGGLRLGDFADPELEMGDILLGGTTCGSDYGFSSREPSEDGHEAGAAGIAIFLEAEETVKNPVEAYALHPPPPEKRDVLGEIAVEPLLAHTPGIITVEEDPMLLVVTTSPNTSPSPSIPTESTTRQATSPSPSPSLDYDSPLPLARGGPVVIPTYHSPIHADTTSPIRPYSIPFVDTSTPPPMEQDEAGPSHHTSTSQYSPAPRDPSPTRNAVTPAAPRYVPANTQFQAKQALKSSLTTSSTSVPPSLALPSPLPLPLVPSTRELTDEEATRRSEAIKKGLAGVFTGKTSSLGAPQRSVSASSSQSSHSSSAGSASTRPGSRMSGSVSGKGKDRATASSSSEVQLKEARSIPSGPATRKRALPGPIAPAGSTMAPQSAAPAVRPPIASSGFSRRPTTAPAPLPRPVLAPRTLPPPQQTIVPPARAAKAAPLKPASAVPIRPVRQTANLPHSQSRGPQLSNMPIYLCAQPLQPTSPNSLSYSASVSTLNYNSNPLKRPLPPSFASHPAVAPRSAISVNGPARPTLGLPSRVVGDQVYTLSSSRMAVVSEGTPEPMDFGGSAFSLGPAGGGSATLGFPSTRSPERLASSFGGGGFDFSLGPAGGGGTATLGFPRFRSPERLTAKLMGGPAVRGTPMKGTTPMSIRTARYGTPSRNKGSTPSRNLGTPSRIIRRPHGPPIQIFSKPPVTSAAGSASPSKDVNAVSTSPTTGPPSANTRHADAGPSSTSGQSMLGAQRGSSEDHEDVSFALPAMGGGSSDTASSPLKTPTDKKAETNVQVEADSSPAAHTRAHGRDVHPSKLPPPPAEDPSPTNGNTRPKRTIKPPAPRPLPVAKGMTVAANTLSIAPNLSEKELKAKTSYNTVRNEKYFCAIDRQVVRLDIPRPPSPTSTIPTTEQREEEAKKRDREIRARRRKGKGKAGVEEEDEEEEEEVLPMIRRLEGAEVVWKGDEEGWEEDERPPKRARVGSVESANEAKGRCVRWDKGLVIIRDEGGPYESGAGKKNVGGKSALKVGKQVELDQNGNIVPSRRPKETLKPLKITVSVRLYEGEEPVVPISQATRGKKKA